MRSPPPLHYLNSSTKDSKELHSQISCQRNIRALNVEISERRYPIHHHGLLLLPCIIINDKYFTSIECQSLSQR